MNVAWGSIAGGIAFAILFLFVIALWLGVIAFWILAIVDIARRPEWQFRLAGQEKVLWLLLTIFVGVIAFVYWFVIRKKVVAVEQAAAAGMIAPWQMAPGGWSAGAGSSWVPPGWHPDPSGTHHLRYWDGLRWTEHVSDPASDVPTASTAPPPPDPVSPVRAPD
jgi:Protein of unknown function (DUF2510)